MKTFKNIDNAVVNVKLCVIITLHEHMRGKLTRKVRLFENSQSNFTRISCHLFYWRDHTYTHTHTASSLLEWLGIIKVSPAVHVWQLCSCFFVISPQCVSFVSQITDDNEALWMHTRHAFTIHKARLLTFSSGTSDNRCASDSCPVAFIDIGSDPEAEKLNASYYDQTTY